MQFLGDFAEDSTVYIPFNTFSSNDPQASVTITNLVAADIKVHKDGSTTDIVTDGATVAIDFDTITGNHLITIDTSVHADYSTGSDYLVRIEGTTVDAGTINAIVGSFSIENRYQHGVAQTADHTAGIADIPTLAEFNARTLVSAGYASPTNITAGTITTTTNLTNLPAITTNWLTATGIAASALDGKGDWNTGKTGYSLTQSFPANFADLSISVTTGEIALQTATQASIDAIEVDTNELQGDWVNGGRLDLLLDAIPTTAMRGTDSAATEAKQDIIDTNVDAVKVATDKLTFTVTNQLDSNIQSINDVTITGDGSAAPFDV